MKYLPLVIMTLLLSFRAGSMAPLDNPEWVKVDDVMFESPPTIGANNYLVKVRIYYTDEIRIDIVSDSPAKGPVLECEDALKAMGDSYKTDVNGRILTFVGQCVKGKLILTTKYKNQKKYLIDEFLTKDLVHLGRGVIQTRGFMEAYSELKRFSYYLN